jgi:hypothetical protein
MHRNATGRRVFKLKIRKKGEKMKTRITLFAVIALLGIAVAIQAQKPARNISPVRHPNLAAAQTLLGQAYEKVVAAQKANEWDLGGHAEKAKALIDQASAELKLAAVASNARKGK